MENKLKNVKVHWIDAVIYSASSVPQKLELKPTRKVTEGILFKEGAEWVIVQNPRTITVDDRKRDSREQKKRKATFLYIPHGMIEKIEYESNRKGE
ncbi:MAG: hypothetical protein Q8N22_01490 [bacterium]|nr:hypothetical protein [bacterium]